MSVCDRFHLILIACAFIAAGCAEHRRAQTADPALEAILLAPAAPDRSVAPAVWKDTQSFYARREYSPAWIDKDQPGDQLDAVVDVIRTAERHGLRTEHYGLDAVERERAALAGNDERPDRTRSTPPCSERSLLCEGAKRPAAGPSSRGPRWRARPRMLQSIFSVSG
jgi:hypothetical protein